MNRPLTKSSSRDGSCHRARVAARSDAFAGLKETPQVAVNLSAQLALNLLTFSRRLARLPLTELLGPSLFGAAGDVNPPSQDRLKR